MSSQIVIVTGASSGFGWMSALRLADAGHTVYAGMRATAGRNADKVADVQAYAAEHGLNLRAIEMAVPDRASVHTATAEAYEEFYAGLTDQVTAKLTELEPADADPSEVARAVVRVVDAPHGKRPLRTHIDPSQDGAEVVNGVADRLRSDFYERIGLSDLLHPRTVWS